MARAGVSPAGWRNRIVGEANIPPTDLIPNPQNWRIHGSLQSDALAGVLNEVGWVQRVLVNRTTGHVVDGHLRLKLALDRQEPTIPVLYVALSEEEERLVLATLDPLTTLANTDPGMLRTLLDEVQSGDSAVQQMLSDLADAAAVEADLGTDATEDARQAARKATQPVHIKATQPVHIAVAVADVALVEEALRATTLPNRGDALLHICRVFLGTAHGRTES